MGSLLSGTCFPTASQARAEFCGSVNQVWGFGPSLVSASCTSTDYDLVTYSVTLCQDETSCITQVRPYPPFPECDYASAVETSNELFVAALAVFAAVLAAKWLYSKFDPMRQGDHA